MTSFLAAVRVRSGDTWILIHTVAPNTKDPVMRVDQVETFVKVLIGILGIAAVPALSALAFLDVTYWPNFQI